jgi:hypothetical protein
VFFSVGFVVNDWQSKQCDLFIEYESFVPNSATLSVRSNLTCLLDPCNILYSSSFYHYSDNSSSHYYYYHSLVLIYIVINIKWLRLIMQGIGFIIYKYIEYKSNIAGLPSRPGLAPISWIGVNRRAAHTHTLSVCRCHGRQPPSLTQYYTHFRSGSRPLKTYVNCTSLYIEHSFHAGSVNVDGQKIHDRIWYRCRKLLWLSACWQTHTHTQTYPHKHTPRRDR